MKPMDPLFTLIATETTETGFSALLRYNPSHPIYKAHFPGNPITPGACLLQTAGEVLQQKMGRPLYLKTAKNIKYLNLLVPEEHKTVTFSYSNLFENETECSVRLVIADESSVYSKMSLTFSYVPL